MKPILLISIFAVAVAGQHQHPAAAPAEKPVALYPGLGTWTHPIATRNPEAQKFFDQGLALLYGFNRPEALRSFRRAAELDPQAAMPHWGIAMALGPYLNMDMDPDVHTPEACEAVAAGLRSSSSDDAGRAWLEAARARCPDFSEPLKYVAAMRSMAVQYADDPDAQTWYAESLLLPVRWRWYDAQGKAAPGVEEAERVLEAVLRRYPNHPGANHLYIHAVESSPTPERAVPSAQRLMGLVPSAGHMVHMPGHIWLVLGDYNTTVDVNQRAAQVDREYFARTGEIGSYYMYYLHNLQFILYARAMQGRIADAKGAMADMEEAARPLTQAMPEMLDLVNATVTMARLRLCLWDDLLAQPQPPSQRPLAQAMWRLGRTHALAVRHDPAAAAERDAFENWRGRLDAHAAWGNNSLGDVMKLAGAALQARMEPDSGKAAPLWKHAVEIQDGLAYDEPPAWYYPLRESWGAALLGARDAAGAESVFRDGLRRSPRNGRMLFGLRESLKAQGNSDAAAWVDREFQAAWKGADLQLKLAEM